MVKKWPLFFSLTTERIEKERFNIPVTAFKFWDQKEFKSLLSEIMETSAFYKFQVEEEQIQGIVYILIEMFKIRRCMNMLDIHPEFATQYFNQKWHKPISGYRIIKSLWKLKCSGIKKLFKELPIIECDDDYMKVMHYYVLTLTAYKAGAEAIYYRLLTVTIACQAIKPMLLFQEHKNANWNH